MFQIRTVQMATATLEETLARLRSILNSPHTPGWDSRARVEAINAFVNFHYGTRRKGNLTEAFVKILIRAIEHELARSETTVARSSRPAVDLISGD